MDDSDKSDIWMSDKNIWLWRVHELYIAETAEYIWYVSVIHKVFYT